jgi:hypothetical protein
MHLRLDYNIKDHKTPYYMHLRLACTTTIPISP